MPHLDFPFRRPPQDDGSLFCLPSRQRMFVSHPSQSLASPALAPRHVYELCVNGHKAYIVTDADGESRSGIHIAASYETDAEVRHRLRQSVLNERRQMTLSIVR